MSEYKEHRIADVIEETSKIKTLIFEDDIDADPGQFVMAWLPGVSSNPYSVGNDKPFSLTIKKRGNKDSFSAQVMELGKGDALYTSDPKGNSFLDFLKDDYEHYLFAGGIGAIPLAFLAERMKKKPVVMLGAESKDKILFRDRFENSSRGILVMTEDGSYGAPWKGMITDLLDIQVYVHNAQIFICGPPEMLPLSGKKLKKRDVDDEDIIFSVEGGYMKCGSGHCGLCDVDGYRSCKDGPVFTYKTIKDGLNYHRTECGRLEKI